MDLNNFFKVFNWGLLLLWMVAVYGFFNILYTLSGYLLKKSRYIKTTPQIGIILLVKDQEDTIEGIIRSMACQGFRYGAEDNLLSIVVVDDYSKDQTPQILQRLADEYTILKFLQMPKLSINNSPVEAGLSLCDGEVICLLDLRDRIAPKRAEEVISYLTNKRDFWCGSERLEGNKKANAKMPM